MDHTITNDYDLPKQFRDELFGHTDYDALRLDQTEAMVQSLKPRIIARWIVELERERDEALAKLALSAIVPTS